MIAQSLPLCYNHCMEYQLSNDNISLHADSNGAEIISLVCRGKERLWQNETGEWSGHAPVLFPVCGKCSVIVNGKEYPIAKHGFARKREFSVVERGGDYISFRLVSDEETKKVFPCDFAFTVRYCLFGNAVEVVYETENTGTELLYFSCGGHESFALEQPIEHYEIKFEREEKLVALVHDNEGRLTGEKTLLSENGVLPLKREYFKGGNTLIFGNLQSRKATLLQGGRAVAQTEFGDFENFLLWKPKRASMICLEPWLNLPDTVGERKEFSRKKGVVCVPPKGKRIFTRKITYYE